MVMMMFLIIKKEKTMKKIKEMIISAPSKIEAINMLNTWVLFGNITDSQYNKGRELIRITFDRE